MQALLLKVPEVALQLGVSRAKVYELMAKDQLPSVKVDGCRRVRSEDLHAFTSSLQTGWADTASRPSEG
jgi:excisionase family DNA binding protein